MAVLEQHGENDDVHDTHSFFNAVAIKAGSTILVLVAKNSGTDTITSVSDSSNGNYGAAIVTNTDVAAYIKRNVNAGTYAVTVTVSGAGSGWCDAAYEISGVTTGADHQTDSNSETNTTHNMAATGMSGAGFYAGITELGGLSNITVGSGFTSFNGLTGVAGFAQYKIETGASETGPFTTNISVNAASVFVFVPDSTSGSGVSVLRKIRRLVN